MYLSLLLIWPVSDGHGISPDRERSDVDVGSVDATVAEQGVAIEPCVPDIWSKKIAYSFLMSPSCH
jgi:hypothetical protein